MRKINANGLLRSTYVLMGTDFLSVNSTLEEVQETAKKYDCLFEKIDMKVPKMLINCILDRRTVKSFGFLDAENWPYMEKKNYKLIGVDGFIVNATLEEATNYAKINGCSQFKEVPVELQTKLKGHLVTSVEFTKLINNNEKNYFFRDDALNSDVMRAQKR